MTSFIDPPATYLEERGERVERVRALLLGLAFGEAYEFRNEDLVPTPTGTQLACATVDGLIRALGRDTSAQDSVLRNSLFRWAYGRGYHREAIERFFGGGSNWNKGWIVKASPMRRDLGTSPTTVQALGWSAKDPNESFEDLPNRSDGYMALLRTLPLGLHPLEAIGDPRRHVRQALQLTHGGDRALQAALAAFELVQAACQMGGLVNFEMFADRTGLTPTRQVPRSREALEDLTRGDDALSVLQASRYVANSFPEPGDFWEALEFCQVSSPLSKAVGATAGALLGVKHGSAITHAHQFKTLEIGWVIDVLAHDLITEIDEHPGMGKDDIRARRDPWWNEKYPVF